MQQDILRTQIGPKLSELHIESLSRFRQKFPRQVERILGPKSAGGTDHTPGHQTRII